jgi:ketosteroid isomerase-like protein
MSTAERDERAIRTQRRLFNDAISAHDAKRISACWLPDIMVMTSASIPLVGRDAVQAIFERFFADPTFITFVRSTTGIRISADGEHAAETGEWEGSWRGNPLPTIMRGTYLGSWRKEDARWLLQAELFVPLS